MFDNPEFLSKLESIEKRFEELTPQLADPDVIRNRRKFQDLSREHAHLSDLVEHVRTQRKLTAEIADARVMLKDSDPDMREMAKEELGTLQTQQSDAERRIKVLLLPRDPNDEKNVVLEVRAGTGGDEAALFAGDIFRMYTRFAERNRWKLDILTLNESSSGGVKEAIALINGKNAYSRLKYESGVHRVQRVPETETQGRIHTSAATVVVLPEAEDIDIKIEDKDLRIDVMRASGPGGQSVNTTDSAVRITHLPTNLTVICMDEKSQHKNKAKAMTILRTRVYDQEEAKRNAEEREARRDLVKTGDRSEKIRTYNFPQDRMTDHRINLTKHNLPNILDGQLDETIEALRTHFQAEALKSSAN